MTGVTCRGCGEQVTHTDTALAADLTTHDQACPHHTLRGRCDHTGACYQEVEA